MRDAPDYSHAPLDDLLDVAGHLDRERHPERWERLQKEIAARRAAPHVEAPPSPTWRRLLVAYHVGLGVLAAWAMSFTSSTVGMVATGVIALWSIVVGGLLGSGRRAGFRAALVLQVLLVLQVRFHGLTSPNAIGPLVQVGLLFSDEGAIHSFFGMAFQLGDEPPPFSALRFDHVAVNVVPITAMVILRRASRGVSKASTRFRGEPVRP